MILMELASFGFLAQKKKKIMFYFRENLLKTCPSFLIKITLGIVVLIVNNIEVDCCELIYEIIV